MNVALVHIGCTGPFIDSAELPNYLGDCIEQYSTFNDGKISVLTDQKNLVKVVKYPQVVPVILENYYSDKIARLCSFYDHPEKSFWAVSMTRFIYLENFMRAKNLRHLYHFENDVLIYFDISKAHHIFRQLYSNIAITPGGPMMNMTGFMYIDNYRALEHMTDFFIHTLAKLGVDGVRKKYNCSMVHEMSLMAAYYEEYGPQYMAYLPILPFGEFSQNFDKFNAIFDPASWGQFVGGTRDKVPGAKPADHYIGPLLSKNPQYKVEWKDEDGLKCPYFNHDGNLVKINNLHIHSKNLGAFLSRDYALRKARHTYDGFSTHQPVLYEAVKRTTGAVIEIGAGYGSTPMLHELCKKDKRRLLTLDDEEEWLDQFSEYQTPWHVFIHVSDWEAILADERVTAGPYSVAFVDGGPRGVAIKAFKDKVKFMVMHDAQWLPEQFSCGKTVREFKGVEDPGLRTYDDSFKYYKEFYPLMSYWRQDPICGPTLLASNFEPCDWDINFKDYELAESLLS